MKQSEEKTRKSAESLRIGEILTNIGKLDQEQVKKIIRCQEENSLNFGQAAIKLGYVDYQDVETAIAQQYNYAIVEHKSNISLSDELCVALTPQSIEAESFRVLRSQLMLNSLEKGRRAIVLASPVVNSGCSYIASNLAISFAQLNLKTCLVDANLRQPRIADIFGIDKSSPGLSSVLRGALEYDDVIIRDVFPSLSIIPSGQTPPNPQELLSRNELIWTISHLLREFNVVLFDTPQMHSCADARSVAARVGSALLIIRQHKTLISDTEVAIDELLRSGADVVGTVLNKF